MVTTNMLIRRATKEDAEIVAAIGRVAVADAHRLSCSEADLAQYLVANYNHDTIRAELNDPVNIYHLLYYNDTPAGFSKIVLNAAHESITEPNMTKLDRIYLLSDYYDLKLGYQLLHHNIALSKKERQCGIWLFTWIGNERAINFYKRNGFQIIGEHSFRVSGTHYNPNHHMLLRY
jgi:ribosomal protein S18 acetylase RimI-like enzyme